MAKIAYIDHSYHKKTVSTKFIPDLLKSRGHIVDYFWDNSWQGGKSVKISEVKGYDAIIMFQSFCEIEKDYFFKNHHHNITYIPMLDQFGVWRGPIFNTIDFWKPFQGCKVLNFSSQIHGMTIGMGIRSKLFRFYRKPASDIKEKKGLHGFLWVRLDDEVSWELVKKLIGNSHFDSFHFHVAKDPASTRVNLPCKEDIQKYNITISSWFKKKEDFEKIFEKANVFFAPRMEEGIGQSFLEAFSHGQCIVAPNNGTMNEYIQDGVNGLLYDWEKPEKLNFNDVEKIRRRAYESCVIGYEKWKESESALEKYLLMPNNIAYENRYDYFSDYSNFSECNLKEKLIKRIKNKLKRIYLLRVLYNKLKKHWYARGMFLRLGK